MHTSKALAERKTATRGLNVLAAGGVIAIISVTIAAVTLLGVG